MNSFGNVRAAISPWLLCAFLLIAALPSLRAGTVSWVGPSGDWSVASNWSTGSLPGPADDVVIPPGSSIITVTHSTGSDSVNSVVTYQPFTLSGGSLSVSNTLRTDSPLTLSGGTLIGAMVAMTSAGTLVVSSGTLNGVTVNGTLDVGNSVNGAGLVVTNYLTLNGTALVGNPTNGWYGAITFAGTQLLGGNGTVVFGNYGNPALNALRLANDGATLVIGSGITVRGQNGTVGYSAGYGGPQDISVFNQGTIAADVSGGTIVVAAQPLNNPPGGLLESPGGTLDLAGTIAAGGLGSVQSGNGVLGLSGFLANDSQAIILAGTNNTLTLLSGGTIHGGAVVAANGNSLAVSSGTLDGVTVNGTLDIGSTYNGANVTVTNGLTLNGTCYLGNPTNSWYGQINFLGTQSLSGNGTVIFGNQSSLYNSLRLADAGTTLTLGVGIVVQGQNGTIGYVAPFGGPQNVAVINLGTISADVAGGTIMVNALPFTSAGQVISPAGSLSISLWENTGQTIVLGSNTGSLSLNGEVQGGTIIVSDGASLVVGNLTLDGLIVNGTLDIGRTYTGANLTVTNGLTLNGTCYVGNPTNGSYGAITFAGSQRLGGSGTVVFGDSAANALRLANGGATLVIGSGITVRGQNGAVGYSPWYGGPQAISVINQGAISADVSGGTIVVAAQPFNNQQGQLQSPLGTLDLAGTIASGGLGSVQSGNGVFGLSGFLTNDSQIIILAGTNNTLTLLSGGTIHGGAVVATNGNSLAVSAGTLDGVTVDGRLDVGNTYNGANLTVTNGLTLNGTCYVGNPTNGSYGAITFAGSQLLGGSGTVVFGNYGNPTANTLRQANDGATLVIGSGITVRGQNGTVGYSAWYGGPQDVSLINQGTISADMSGTIVVNAQPLNNQQGQLQSPVGTLDLAGTIVAGGLGSVQSGNGVLGLGGFLTNDSQVIILAGTNNALTLLSGGTIHGGAVVATNGNSLAVSAGTLDGVTVEGRLDVGNTYNGANLTVTNGLTLNGTALVGNPTNSGYYGAINFSGSQPLGGNATVEFGSANPWGNDYANALWLSGVGTTLTIGSGVTVRGQNGTIGAAPSTPWYGPGNVSVVNQGTISADVSGGTIVVAAQPLNNPPGGQLQSPVGTLDLAGTIVAGGLGNVQSGNGVLGLSGFLTNDSQTIILAGTNNTLTLLSGGTIHGGAVVATNGNLLAVSSGTLDGVTVNGALDVGSTYNGANLTVTNGLTLNGTCYVGNPTNSWYGQINFVGTQSVSGNGTVIFGNQSSLYNSLRLANAGTTLTLEAGIVVQGQNGTIGYVAPYGGPQNVAVINQGTISANVSGGTIVVAAQPFSNQGALETPGGTLGPGYVENTGQTFVVGNGNSSLALSGGWIHGGSMVMSNGARLVVGNLTLDGVTVTGNLDIGNQIYGGVLTVTNGLTLNGTAYVGASGNGSYGSIAFAGNQSLVGDGTVVFGGNGNNALWLTLGGTTLVLGQDVTVRGQSGFVGGAPNFGGPANVSVVNHGSILVDVPNGSVAITGASFENDGLLEVEDGAGLQPTVGMVTNTGTIRIDRATVTFSGDFVQTSGTLDFGLSSPGGNGQIILGGASTVNGTLAAHLEDGYAPAPGDSFAIVNYGPNFVVFTNFNLPGPELWATNYKNGILTLSVTNGYELEVSVTLAHEMVALGSDVTFTATVNQPGTFGFQWLDNGTNLPGATNATLILSGVSLANSGAYSVVVINPFTSASSAPVQLTVLAPAVILDPPAPASAHVGGDVTFNVGVSGDPPLAYQWYFNGTPITWAVGPSLTLSAVGRPQAGAYSVAVGNPAGSVTSAPVALTILTGPDCSDAPAGMLAWWRGEGNAYDYAGTNDLTFVEAAYAPGEVGQAFALNGATSYLTTPANGLAPSGTNDFSIEFWANFTALKPSTMAGDGSVAFIARDEGLGDLNKWVFGFGGGTLYFYVNGPGLGPNFLAQAPFIPVTNQWYHLAITRGGAVFHVFVDGTQVSAETNNLPIPPANAALTIGQAQGLFMQGLLDEISIYNRALGANELLAIYQAGSQGKCQAGQNSQRLAIEQVGFNSGGHFQFQILGGQVGATIQVQASADLAHWTNLWQTINTNGVASFTDPNSAQTSRCFYRAISNP